MDAVQNGESYTFINPRTEEPHIATEETKDMYERYGLGEHVEVGEELSIPAELIWERIVDGAHENGEPGVIYLDRVNKKHSFPVDVTEAGYEGDHVMNATNPCGEQPLQEYEACNLGHINLSTIAATGNHDWRAFDSDATTLEDSVSEFLEEAINWDDFNNRIEYGTRFLENVVTMSDFPVDKIEETVANNRKIGLGIMGLAQLYIQLGVKYGTEEGNEIARQLMMHINHDSKDASHELAGERGSFNNWDESKYADPTQYADWFEHHTGEDASDWEDGYPIRNHNTTTIAPTGTTSMVGNTTGGCEPIYNVAFYKNVSDDVQGDEMLVEFDDYFLRTLKENGLDVDAVKQEAESQMAANEFDGVDGLETVPDAIGELFITTGDLSEFSTQACSVRVRKVWTRQFPRPVTSRTTPVSRTWTRCTATSTKTAERASPSTATARARSRFSPRALRTRNSRMSPKLRNNSSSRSRTCSAASPRSRNTMKSRSTFARKSGRCWKRWKSRIRV